ncbi:unnamed protein product [Brachionus calyciflorus]|uniref:Tc1-like transposase DDE domain-containing protein n=1 Tax=Brachionus calyciflorus TaxID=104777 RepID=A0A814EWJ3_9BILA|nr:unnamed protein product [Brachionus calyciflorus]
MQIEDYLLQRTNEEKDLGVYITSGLKWRKHCTIAASKANRALGQIRNSFCYLEHNKFKLLYNALGRVVFSDESNFEVFNRKSKVILKRLNNEKYHPKFCVPRLQNGGGSAGIWGCISSKGTGVCNMDTGRNNQYVSKEIPKIIFYRLFYDPEDHWIFQQDNSSAHTSHSIRDWLKSKTLKYFHGALDLLI